MIQQFEHCHRRRHQSWTFGLERRLNFDIRLSAPQHAWKTATAAMLCAAKFQRRLSAIAHIQNNMRCVARLWCAAGEPRRRLNYERTTVLSVGARRVYVKRTTGKNLLCASLSLPSHHRRTRAARARSHIHKAAPLFFSLAARNHFLLLDNAHFSYSFRPHLGRGTNIWFPFPALCSVVSCLHMLSAAFSFPPCFIHFDFLCNFLSYVCILFLFLPLARAEPFICSDLFMMK